MTRSNHRLETTSRVLLSLAAVLALLLTAAPTLANASLATVEIQSVDLRETPTGAELTVQGDGALVWTQYRNEDGDLVVELPNTVLAGEVLPPAPRGVVSSVVLEPEPNRTRPMTRLIISTEEATEHTLFGNDGLLTLTFERALDSARPTGSETAQTVPALNEATATEPESEPMEPVLPTEPESIPVEEPQEASATPQAPEPTVSTPAMGTPEEPATGPEPSGVRATRLFGVEVVDLEDKVALRIEGDGDFRYTTFRLENPPRFVIDLQGVVNSASRSRVGVDRAEIAQVRMAQFRPYPDPVTRIVLDLVGDATPVIEPSGDGLWIRFADLSQMELTDSDPADAAEEAQVAEATEPEPEAEAARESEPTDVAAAEGTVTEPTAAEPDVSMAGEEPQDLEVAEVTNEELVDAPGTAEEGVSASYADDGAGQESTYEESSYEQADQGPGSEEPRYADEPEADDPVFAEEEPLEITDDTRREAPTSDVSLFEAQQTETAPADVLRNDDPRGFAVQRLDSDTRWVGEPLDLTVKDASLVEVLRTIARYAELNLIVQPGIDTPVSVEFVRVPWDQALDQILKMNRLDKQLEGNILRVARKDLFRQEAVENQELAAARALSVPLSTVIKRLSYADAQDVSGILTRSEQGQSGGGGMGGRAFSQDAGILSQRGSVSVDDRTNTLIIKELPDYLDTVIQVIENLDIPEKQVMIEARVVETTRSFGRSLGIDWSFGGSATAATGNTTGLQFPNRVETGGGVQLLTGGDNGFFNLSMGNILNTLQLDLALQAAENEGLVNVISAPKIATLNNFPAQIETGLQLPVQTVTGGGGTTAGGLVNPFGTVSVSFIRASLRMQVRPQVTFEGTILLNVSIEKDEPQFALQVQGAPSAPISTRRASTRVRVADGGTAVIGGIYQVSTNEAEARVPGLARVPILGQLFKNRDRSTENQELLIFITPRVIQQ